MFNLVKFSLNNSEIAWYNVIRKTFSTNDNDGFYLLMFCYLDGGIAIF